MGKEIIVRDVHVLKAFRTPTALFTVLMKYFVKTEINAFMDAEDIFHVMSTESDIRLIFSNNKVKDSFFCQLNSSDKALFERLEKKQIFVEI